MTGAALAAAAGLFRARRYRECLAAVDAVLAGGPHPAALHIRAECLVAAGRLDEAAGAFEAALVLAPFTGAAWVGRADLELWREGLAGWEAVVDRALTRPVLPPEGFHFLVRKACLLWMRGEVAGCGAIVGYLSAELGRQGAALAGVLRGYTVSTAVHLRGLLLAEGTGRGRRMAGAEALPPLFLLGDSHCIGPAGSVVTLRGQPHVVRPLYVLGCKAWHLAGAGAEHLGNPYRACAERRAAGLPGGAAVMVSAGDIDCRAGSGFDNLRRRVSAPELAAAIRDTAAGYVGWVRRVLARAGAGEGEAMVLLHPARRAEGTGEAGGDGGQAAVLEIDRRFREAVAEACGRAAVGLVDLGALTADAPEWFVDTHHVAGGALGAALARL